MNKREFEGINPLKESSPYPYKERGIKGERLLSIETGLYSYNTIPRLRFLSSFMLHSEGGLI